MQAQSNSAARSRKHFCHVNVTVISLCIVELKISLSTISKCVKVGADLIYVDGQTDKNFNSLRILYQDCAIDSSKSISPSKAFWCFLFQISVSSQFFNFIQQLFTSSSSSSNLFCYSLHLSFNNVHQKAVATRDVTSPVQLFLLLCIIYRLFALYVGYLHCIQFICIAYSLFGLHIVYLHCIQFIRIAYRLFALHIVYSHCIQVICIAYSLFALHVVYSHCIQLIPAPFHFMQYAIFHAFGPDCSS